MKISRLYIIVFLTVSLFGNIQAQEKNAIIYGTITNANNEPVEDVTISILGSTLPPVSSNTTGSYEYVVPAGQEITIVFSNISYARDQITITPKPGEKINLSPKLKQASNTQLTTVEVTDNETRNTSAVKINPKVISFIPTPSGDFNAIIFSQMGVSSRNELSSGYSVRGGNFDENLVYVNGIEIYRPFLTRSGQQEGLSFINPDMVSSILFSAGGFEAKYGDKLSSVLDVEYRKPRTFAGTVSMSALGGAIHLENKSNDSRLRWITGIRYKSSRYVLNSLDTKGDYLPWFADGQLFVMYDLNEKWELNFLGNFANNSFNVIPSSRETNFGTINQALRLTVYFDGQEKDQFRTGTAAISLINRPNEKTKLQFTSSVFRSLESETFDIMGQYYIDQLEVDFGKKNFGDVAFNRGVGTFLNHARNYLDALVFNVEHKGWHNVNKGQWLWGAKLQHEDIIDELSEWRYVDSAGYALPQAPATSIEMQDVIKSNNTLQSNRIQGYLQRTLKFNPTDSSNCTLTIGVRAHYWDVNKQTVVSPRATFAYKPHWKKDILFRLSSGYYYQPPFYRELRDLDGKIHLNVKAQQSIHFLLATDINFKAWGRPFKFVTEAYYKLMNDVIPYEVDNVRIRYYANNNATAFARGIDFKINGEFINGIESWASVNLLQTKENITNDYYYLRYNSDGEQIYSGYTANYIAVDSVRKEPGNIPRPTDQLVGFSLFFQDYLPKLPDCKMHLNLLFGTALPFGPPSYERYKDTLRMPPYRRVDIGFSYQIIKEGKKMRDKNPFRYFKSMWISLEVFNLLQVSNTISYTWVADVTGRQYAIPNYLTSRQLNLRLITKF